MQIGAVTHVAWPTASKCADERSQTLNQTHTASDANSGYLAKAIGTSSDNCSSVAMKLNPWGQVMPLEMHGYIIDSFDNETDSGTIACCALVCHAWLPFSRSKLYRKICLTSRTQWDLFKFHIILPTPHIVTYLRRAQELCVLPSDRETNVPWFWSTFQGPDNGGELSWIHLVLDYCATGLPNLQTYTFRQIDWTRPGFHKDAIVKCTSYLSLTSLRLDECKFSNDHQLCLLAISLPSLSNLFLRRILLQDTGHLSKEHSRRVQGLTKLEIHQCGEEVGRWLGDIHWLYDLSHLEWLPTAISPSREVWDRLSTPIGDFSLRYFKGMLPPNWQCMYVY